MLRLMLRLVCGVAFDLDVEVGCFYFAFASGNLHVAICNLHIGVCSLQFAIVFAPFDTVSDNCGLVIVFCFVFECWVDLLVVLFCFWSLTLALSLLMKCCFN